MSTTLTRCERAPRRRAEIRRTPFAPARAEAGPRPDRMVSGDFRAPRSLRAFSRGTAVGGLRGMATTLTRCRQPLGARETASHSPNCAPPLITRESDFCGVCPESLVQFVSLDAVSTILVRAPQVGRRRQSLASALRRRAAAGRRSIRHERKLAGGLSERMSVRGGSSGRSGFLLATSTIDRMGQEHSLICPAIWSECRSEWRPAILRAPAQAPHDQRVRRRRRPSPRR